MTVSLVDLNEKWSFDDLIMANDVLDALDDAESRAIQAARETGDG